MLTFYFSVSRSMSSLTTLITSSIAIAIVVISITWLFARTFFFRLFSFVLKLFSEYVTQLQRAATGAQVLNTFAQFVIYLFSPDTKIIIWFAFNKKTMPLLGCNVDSKVLQSPQIRSEFSKMSGHMLVDTEDASFAKHLPYTAKRIPGIRRLFSFPFIHKGSLFGVVHILIPARHIGFRRRSLTHLYASVARSRFTQLAAERDTIRIASDIGAIERSFEALIDSAPLGMIICETDLSVRYMNEAAGSCLEAKSLEQTGSLLLDHFPQQESCEKIHTLIENILQRKKKQELAPKFNYVSKSNTHKIFDIHVYPIKSSSGKILEIVFVLHDRTKRYLLEEELALTQQEYQRELEEKVRIATYELVNANKELTRLNAIKSEFVSTISHELRTPLTSIIGYLSLLESKKLGALTSKQKESVTILSSEAKRLASLINDILDLSRLESGKSSLKLTTFSVDELIRKVITIMQPLVDKKKQIMTFEHPHSVDIHADESKLQQVLTNILSNAIKFTPGGKKIQLRLLKDAKSCIISVQDQGIGIAQKDMPLIFESFHRGDVASQHAIQGTGLGLTIVKHIVDMHNGKITVQSHVGRGTRVTVILPLKQK